MRAEFEQMKNIEFVGDAVTIKTTVKPADIEALDALAEQIK